MASPERPLLPNNLDIIFQEISNAFHKDRLGELPTDQFEHRVKSSLQEYYKALVEYGFGTTEAAVEPTSYLLGKLEGYLECLAALGQESVAHELEGVIGRTMVAVYKARILQITY